MDLLPVPVNSLQPDYVDTPVKRIVHAEEIADAVLSLMKNGSVTGINLVGGGALLV